MTDDPWEDLRRLTSARIGLGRSGDGLPTEHALAFQMAHARARDAVHAALDADALRADLAARGIGLPVVVVRSAAPDRATYLQRPDLGRRLAGEAPLAGGEGCDLAVVIGDGLSAGAVQRHAAATLAALLEGLDGWRVGPVVIAHQARVALVDPVGERLGARLGLILIGERPGLSAADSLGAYLTHAPRPGRQNAERNCVSNIRPEGLTPAVAGARLAWLVRAARDAGLTGVDLKDESAGMLAGEGASVSAVTDAGGGRG